MSAESRIESSVPAAMLQKPSPLQAPPTVLIPGKQIPKHIKRTRSPSEMDPMPVPVTPVDDEGNVDEKIGRWSEIEHKVFLEGLEQYGKQWKTISTLIGTRTVVQVRTHAQKYFQKLERKNKSKAPPLPATPTKVNKRKSLPTSLPSRKKPRVQCTKPVISRSVSLSLVNVSSPTAELPNLASTASLSSENWSTVSPTGVVELDMHLQDSASSEKENMFLVEDPLTKVESDAMEDPLDWLIDGGIGHLPESSLDQTPVFPDFSDLSSDVYVLDAEESGSVSYPVLRDIPDPRVTVQSLFLDDGDDHLH